MFSSSITSYVIAIIAFLLHTSAYGQDRTINAEINPGCNNCSLESTLVYIRAEGQTDTIHQVWDFTRGIPTIILAVSGTNSTMQIAWDGIRPVNFTVNETVRYSFATAIDKIYEYNDLDDKGRMDEKSWIHSQSLKRVTWELKEQIITEKEAMVRLHGTMHQNRSKDIIDIKLDLLPYKDYATELPHLIHTANSTLVDISLVNLTTSRYYNSSRFALHLVLVSTDSATDTMHNVMRKSLDDEHTPGVFEIIEIKTPASLSSEAGGFVQFRPVGYTQRARNVGSSTIAHVSDFNRTSLPDWSTLKTFYRGFDEGNLLVQDMVVCFGEPGDGFYKRYNYTAWSYTIGYGAPPMEGFSLFVIVIISVGLGVPVLLALSGVLYAVRRKYRHNAHTQLTNED
ncbi:PREDICTED: glycosylated lysosomal membrane protein B-like [Papilio xuthus]|uniref:Glycosylated lysosomal membrane protein B-like n=1 Tax=Papilio xuthus TaxID=66420 RepID=A0AAJ6ZJD2_PAPXU|nr:PREDICTED: glycosylated lysosomal membrane protein B-like [Papilio xuthus]